MNCFKKYSTFNNYKSELSYYKIKSVKIKKTIKKYLKAQILR